MLIYIFCDSNDRFVLSDSRFLKIFKSCQKAMKSFDLSFKNDVAYSILLKPLFQKKYHFLGMGVHKSNSLI